MKYFTSSYYISDFFFFKLLIYLAVLGLSCSMQNLSCGICNLVP